MKVYCLKGHGERGKSTTLKKLIINIFDAFPCSKVIYSKGSISKNKILNDIYTERFLRRKKSCCVVENLQIVIDIDGKIVGVNTAGDNCKEIKNSICLFDRFDCDIGFCACRSKGSTGNLLQAKYNKDVEFVLKAEIKNAEKYKNYDDWIDLINDWQAEELLKNLI